MVDMPQNPTKPNSLYLIYMYKEDLALNNLQRLICHKTNPTKNKIEYFYCAITYCGVAENKNAYLLINRDSCLKCPSIRN